MLTEKKTLTKTIIKSIATVIIINRQTDPGSEASVKRLADGRSCRGALSRGAQPGAVT